MDKNKSLLLLLIAGLGISAFIALFQLSHMGKGGAESSIVTPNFGGPFTLTDQTGKTVTEKDFEGRYRLIYFGFTFCPAICPTELAKMAETLKRLGEKAEKITPIFITIDPERDTKEAMAEYVTLFHPRLIGLTGTPEQIAQAAKGYKVYYAKVEDPSLSEYTMDHSSYIYFMGPDNTLLALYKSGDTAEKIAADIEKKLN